MTNRSEPRRKLKYAFDLYDADNSGYLDHQELIAVIYGMFDLLGANHKGNNSQDLAKECMIQLDKSKDGKISREEFVNGLLENYSLRAYLFDHKI